MPYGKSRPENRFRNEAAFFIGQMEVQIRVNQSVTDGEYGIYGFYSSEAPRVCPMKALTELKEEYGYRRYAGWLSLRKRRCWECLYHVH